MEKNINWPIGNAKLVQKTSEIPMPRKPIGKLSGYFFYKTRRGEYAIKIYDYNGK